MAYYRVYYQKAGGDQTSLDVTADTVEAAEAHARYVATDPERKELALTKYGDRRLRLANPQLVPDDELPEIIINRVVELKKTHNQFAEA